MANLPVVKQDDVELSIDLHDGFAFWPPVPPMEAGWWVHVCGAKLCWVSDCGNWGVMSSGDPSKNVFINDKKAINQGHDIGFFIPHIWIPFVNNKGQGLINLLFPLTCSLSQAQVLLGAGAVLVNDKPIGAGPYPSITCNDPIPLPTGVFITVTDVKVGFTWADFFEALKQYAIQVAVAVLMMVATKGGKKAWGKIKAKKAAKIQKKLVEAAAKEAAERAGREAAQETAETITQKAAMEAAQEGTEKAAKESAEAGAKEALERAGQHEMLESAERGVKETAERAAKEAAEEAQEKATREALERQSREAAEKAAKEAQEKAGVAAGRETEERAAKEASERAAAEARQEAAECAGREASARAEKEAAEETAQQAAKDASEAAQREAAANQAKDAAEAAHKEAVDKYNQLQKQLDDCWPWQKDKMNKIQAEMVNAKFAAEKAAGEFAEASRREAAERAANEVAQQAGREALERAEEAAAREAQERLAREAAEEAAEKASKEAASHATEETAARQAREAAEQSAQELNDKARQAGQREAQAQAEREAAERAAADARRKAAEAANNEALNKAEKERLEQEAERLTREAQEAAVREQAAREAREESMKQFEKAEADLSEALAREEAARVAREAAEKKVIELQIKAQRAALQKAIGQYATWGNFAEDYGLKLLKVLKLTKPFVLPPIKEGMSEVLEWLGIKSEDQPDTAEDAATAMALTMGDLLAGRETMGTEPDDSGHGEERPSAIEQAIRALFDKKEAEELLDFFRENDEYRLLMRQFVNGPLAGLFRTFMKLELWGLEAFDGEELCDIGIPVSLHEYVKKPVN